MDALSEKLDHSPQDHTLSSSLLGLHTPRHRGQLSPGPRATGLSALMWAGVKGQLCLAGRFLQPGGDFLNKSLPDSD